MSETLIDVVDSQTGEIYKNGELAANAHIWCAEFGWKVVNEDFYDGHHWEGEWIPASRSLYVEATQGGGRYPV